MARKDFSTILKSLLMQFICEKDPLLSMLEWMANQLMRMEAENKVGAEKGKHTSVQDQESVLVACAEIYFSVLVV